MRELSLNVMDIAQNSISAGASCITVDVCEDTALDRLTIRIVDNGRGMTAEQVARVIDPFFTTRTTRKVGLGIPLFKQVAEMCGGKLTLQSTVGKGTKTQATFIASHMDLPPMGDLKGTLETLIIANPDKPDFCLIYRVDEEEFVFDTAVIREAVGGLPLNEPEIVGWIGQYIAEGIGEVEQSRAGR